jgi:hypothetical protein
MRIDSGNENGALSGGTGAFQEDLGAGSDACVGPTRQIDVGEGRPPGQVLALSKAAMHLKSSINPS